MQKHRLRTVDVDDLCDVLVSAMEEVTILAPVNSCVLNVSVDDYHPLIVDDPVVRYPVSVRIVHPGLSTDHYIILTKEKGNIELNINCVFPCVNHSINESMKIIIDVQ